MKRVSWRSIGDVKAGAGILLKVRSYLSGSELSQATKKSGNKYLRTCSTHGGNEKCNRRFYVKNLRVGGNVMLKRMCEQERHDVPVWTGSMYSGTEVHDDLW